MRKTKFVLLMLIILVSFAMVRVFGGTSQGSISSGENDQRLLVPSAENALADSATANGDGGAGVLSQNVISSSSVVINGASGNCDLNLTASEGLVRLFGQNYSLAEFNANNHWPLASITKLMTAIVAYENMNLQKNITFSSEAASLEGSAGDFKAGETFKASDIMKAMLMLSSNRAAEALAEDFGKDKFISLMNQKAKELSLSDTAYFDPTGLSSSNQSTANDIYKLASYIYNTHPEIFSITRQAKTYIVELNSHKKRLITNINQFAGQANFIGGKTGFIDESQGNLVSVFKIDNQVVITVILGSQDRFGETKKLLNCANL